MKKILVIKMRHHGDVLLTSPVFSNLKRAFPEAEIDAMVYADTAPMLEGHPAIRSFVMYDRAWKKLGWVKRWAKEWGVLRRIRQEKYDLVMNLTEGDRGAIAALVSGAKWRVGFDPEGKGFWGKRSIYTHVVKMCKTPRHTVEKNLDAVRKMGIFPGEDERELLFSISEKDTMRAREFLGEVENYVLIHPASRWKFKCWPVEKMAALIQELHARGEKIVMTASPDSKEVEMVEEIVAKVPQVPVVNLAGKTSLKQLGALIWGSKVLVCVDSVPLHIASALKAPVVVLFGPSSEVNWGPWNHPRAQVVTQNFACRPCFMDGCGGSKRSDCLATLPVNRVLNAIQSLNSSPK